MTRVLNASDSDDEVRCVGRQVTTALATSPAHRVAVLYASATPYVRLFDIRPEKPYGRRS